ncbi:MAG: type II toxin-antitoxin system prevent-host-death family antitoxin [Acidobacteriota bacterium]
MTSVGIRHLKANLSRYLREAQAGVEVQITEHGRPIATIVGLAPRADVAWARKWVAEGGAHWNGGKLQVRPGVRPKRGAPLASDIVIQDRR